MPPPWDFRDISAILRKWRQFLLGRKHELENLHVRFPPRISPRSIPTPDIPRGPASINKYYDQWYCDRNARDSVKPPIVGPLGQGPAYPLDCTKKPQPTNLKPSAGVRMNALPTASGEVAKISRRDNVEQFFGAQPVIQAIEHAQVTFSCPPTPGTPWWWDGHCYFECVPDKSIVAPPPPDPCAKAKS